MEGAVGGPDLNQLPRYFQVSIPCSEDPQPPVPPVSRDPPVASGPSGDTSGQYGPSWGSWAREVEDDYSSNPAQGRFPQGPQFPR